MIKMTNRPPLRVLRMVLMAVLLLAAIMELVPENEGISDGRKKPAELTLTNSALSKP